MSDLPELMTAHACDDCGPCVEPEYYPLCGGAQLCPAHHIGGAGVGRLAEPVELAPDWYRYGCR